MIAIKQNTTVKDSSKIIRPTCDKQRNYSTYTSIYFSW